MLLQSKMEDVLLLMGICCSTYVTVNRGKGPSRPIEGSS